MINDVSSTSSRQQQSLKKEGHHYPVQIFVDKTGQVLMVFNDYLVSGNELLLFSGKISKSEKLELKFFALVMTQLDELST